MNAVINLPRAFKALDIPVTFTHFKNLAAQAKSERELKRFRDLVEVIEQTQAPTKATLPLLSFARYGNERTPKGSYRHDANVGMITAISGDHDDGTMTVEEAQSRLAAFDIAAVIHTTASHTASAPRWHVFCPLLLGLMGGSGRRGLDRFRGLVALLNGILGGALKGESFALSQPYYYGHVEGVEYHVAVVDGANTLDSPDSFNFGSAQPIYPHRERDDRPSAGKSGKASAGTTGRERDNTRSGKARRLAHRIKVVERGTYDDFSDAVDADPELAEWRAEKGERQMLRAWNSVEDPPGFDEFDDIDWDIAPDGKLRNGGQYKMKNVEWVWPGWLARGKLHILGGRKSGGKSTVLYNVVAAITSGGKFPDGTKAPLGDVVIWSSEDAIDDTILPRIAAMGGDISRVHFVDHVTGDDGKPRGFDPSIDMPTLAELSKTLPNLILMGIDPIVSASRADSHKNAETRIGLQPVVNFAEERNVVVVGITHFTKNTQGRDPVERITGTLAYGALARVVMGVAADIEDMAKPRRLVRIASNIGPTGDGFEYTLEQKEVEGHDITNQAVVWGAPITGSALSLITEVEGEPDHRRGSTKETPNNDGVGDVLAVAA